MSDYCRVCGGFDDYEIAVEECRYKSTIQLCYECKKKYDDKTLGIVICSKCGLFFLEKDQKHFPHSCPIRVTCNTCGANSEFMTCGDAKQPTFDIGAEYIKCHKCSGGKMIISAQQYDYVRIVTI